MQNKTQFNSGAVIFVTAANVPALCFAVNEAGQNVGASWKVDGEGYQDLAAEREAITAREYALYFTPNGVLDLSAWLTIQKERAAAAAASEANSEALNDKAKAMAGRYPAAALREGSWSTPNPLKSGEGVTLGESVDCSAKAFIPLMAYNAWESGQGVRLSYTGPYLSKAKGDACPAVVLAAMEWQNTYHAALDSLGFEALEDLENTAHDLLLEADRAVILAPAYSYQDVQAKLAVMTESLRPLDVGAEVWAAVKSIKADMIRAA